jgi:hypothetical protein
MVDNLYEINIGSINICLCSDCFRKTRIKMNEVSIDGYKGKAEREDKCKNCEYYHNPDYTRCHECEVERSE